MRELSLAFVIARKVLALAEEQPFAHVREVRLAVGEWTSVQAEQLVYCYGAVTEDTPLVDSILAIEPVAGVVKCPHCGYTGRPKFWEDSHWLAAIPTLMCPECERSAEMVEGHQCAIRAIHYASGPGGSSAGRHDGQSGENPGNDLNSPATHFQNFVAYVE